MGNACIGSVGADAECGMLIDFRDRNVSYAMFCFNKFDVPRYAAELRESVELQSPGHEPHVLEIRLSQ
jgi:hypothetical protein